MYVPLDGALIKSGTIPTVYITKYCITRKIFVTLLSKVTFKTRIWDCCGYYVYSFNLILVLYFMSDSL